MVDNIKTCVKKLEATMRYRATPKGVLTNMYNHMKKRNSVDFSLKDFHDRFLTDKKYLRIHKEWIDSGRDKMKKPSLDRISNLKSYTVRNTHMMTWGENRFKQTMERRSRKGVVIQYLDGIEVARYSSQKEAAKKTGLKQGNMSLQMSGLRKSCGGFVFKFERDFINE